MKKIDLNWKHIMDEQPSHGEFVVQCYPADDNHIPIGIMNYYSTIDFKGYIASCQEQGIPLPDFYWISAKDFPFPNMNRKLIHKGQYEY